MSSSSRSPQRAVRRTAPRRRTQAERRATTRAALLDATIASLVEDGYAGTTTRRVAERAGVTPGALQHHFPSKADLVTEAIKDLAERLATQFLESAVETSDSYEARAESLIDNLWEVHRGPLFVAALELWVAARTDPEPRASVETITAELAQRIAEGALYAFPDMVARPGFPETIVTGLATMRGLALQGFAEGADPELFWPATRAHLLSLFAAVEPADGGTRSR